MAAAIKHVRTATLDIAYEESGEGAPVILLHGFPYDAARVRRDAAAAARLPRDRAVPARLRPTRFLSRTRCARASRRRSATI
jgi:pimeloyl-ACP methyl ester carboxylesterase